MTSFARPSTTTAYPPLARHRAACVVAFAAVLLLGLASRRWQAGLPDLFGKYPGDASWALMVFFGWAALRPRATTTRIALLACATSATTEACKLWQDPWIVQIRHTTLGHLVLGHVFSWQNLVAYALGVMAGIALDPLLLAPLRVPARATRHDTVP
jgi:hypothetical protein